MLTTTVQLPGATTNNSQMLMYTSMSNTDISISREFKKHLSDPTCAHGLIDHGKDRKRDSKRKFMDWEYHVQNSKDVQQKQVKMSWDPTQFQEFPFCGPHKAPME